MVTPLWQPGTLYQPGDLVRPASTPPVTATPPLNKDFEDGDTDWTKGTGWTITNSPPYRNAFNGSWAAYCSFTGISYLQNDEVVPVTPGQVITASCQGNQAGTADNINTVWVGIRWLDASDVQISISTGNVITQSSSGTPWRQSTVTATAPVNAAKAQLVIGQDRLSGSNQSGADAATWDYTFSASPDAVVYRATQVSAAYSGSTEPVWPGFGNTVVDNGVTWEGVDASRVVWEATPILVSGGSEPTWPTSAGGTVLDNTIIWVASTGFVEQAPNSKIVAIGAKKIFAADGDIVKFSATVNPLDWTTEDDAGYLPTGLQTFGANPMMVLQLFRSNLACMNSAGLQSWQIDEDPQLMRILDAIPVGSTFTHAAQPVVNDLPFLSSKGVRNLAIAGGSTNLQAGSYGEPIDPLVLAAIKSGLVPGSIFYPAQGQYLLWFGPQVFVLTMSGERASWSRYVYPEAITDATLLNEVLYLRTENHKVWKFDSDTLYDDTASSVVTITIASPGVVSWTAHGYNNGDQIRFTTTGALPTGLAINTTYYIVNKAANTFQLALTAGGTAIVTTGTQSGVHTAAGRVVFDGTVWWPWLTGKGGATTGMVGFDLVCKGAVGVQVGTDQRNPATLTTLYSLADGDTVPGTPVPMPVAAPSYSLKLTFPGGQAWEWLAANLYLNDWNGIGALG